MEKAPQSLGEFIELTGSNMQVFDMGRRISPISAENFASFEAALTAYPFPFQQQAIFAVLLWNLSDNGENHSVWFLKFPLDEMGMLIQASRDDLLNRLLEKTAFAPENQEDGDKFEAALKDNPYSFTPGTEKMAIFHAKAASLLEHSPSKYYGHALDYFNGKKGMDQWSFVGLQGIADIACRLDQYDHESILARAISQLPDAPSSALYSCLENELIGKRLTTEIIKKANVQMEKAEGTESNQLAMAIRAIACTKEKSEQKRFYADILASQYSIDVEILAAIAARSWEALEDPELMASYLEKLAEAGNETFQALLSDLLYLPGMRLLVLQALRNPDRSEVLTEAIGEMFKKAI